jgi:four helix bundle protein
MAISRFEELNIWKVSRKLVNSIYTLTAKEKFSKDFGLKDQIQRAAVSIMNNIAEGFERKSNNEFIRFLYFSKGSTGEVRSLLYVVLDLQYITEKEFEENYKLSIDLITQIANFIKYLKNNNYEKN